ncbi:transposase [Chryseobacterium capnotolerans]|uniref:ISAon1 family transposase N-terminal region protein n=1 Tax=Chryseobacterium TaxID=59732 RepID=UPI00083A06A3|nr:MULTISPECIES: transposase [Chryseobacterium]UHO36685.1 transposase [Chryseobacterium capnotolerans]
MLSDHELLKLLLPEFLVENFDILKAEEHNGELHIYFEEKNSIPQEFKERQLESKGFLAEIIVDDYPLRGKIVKLHVKRRRWTDKSSGEILQRDWQLVSKGTRMTKDFAGFLKKISRY